MTTDESIACVCDNCSDCVCATCMCTDCQCANCAHGS